MGHIQITETFPHRAGDLMTLVMDAQRYKEISSYITDIDVTRKSDTAIAVLTAIEAPFLKTHYGCDLEHIPPDRIVAMATQSPFKALSGSLVFRTLPNGHTAVDCTIDYKTGFNPLAIAAAAIMETQIRRAVNLARDYLAAALPLVPAAPPPGAAPAP